MPLDWLDSPTVTSPHEPRRTEVPRLDYRRHRDESAQRGNRHRHMSPVARGPISRRGNLVGTPRACRRCVYRVTLEIRRGRLNGPPVDHVLDGFGLLVLEGLLLRRVDVGARSAAELLGPGDLLRAREVYNAQRILPQASAWRALQGTRLAVLDDGVVERMAHYSGVIGRLLDRSVERSRRLAVNMAIVHRPRVDIRLQMLFWHLAERWGRPCDGRTMLPLRLTHTILAPSLSTSGETLTIEELLTLRARTETAGNVGDEHEWSWSRRRG